MLTERGTLVANSEQIFNTGLTDRGLENGTGGVRTDANDAINFKAGTLILNDDDYNDTYLKDANDKIQAADGGTTNVVIDHEKAYRDVSLIPNNSYFAGIRVNYHVMSLGDAGNTSVVQKLNGTSIDLVPVPDSEPNKENRVGILNGRELHLGSAISGRELLTVNGKTPPNGVINVREGSKLTLGVTEVENRINGSVNLLEKDAKLDISRGWLNIGTVKAKADTQINVGSGTTLTTNNGITLNGNAEMQVNGLVTQSNIAGDPKSVIRIGDGWHSGSMLIGSKADGTPYTMSGFDGSIFLNSGKNLHDRIWRGYERIENASQFALEDASNIHFRLTVGKNSLASLGTANSLEAINTFYDAGLKWGENDITSALYLAKPVNLDANSNGSVGGIKVDGKAIGDDASNQANNGMAEFGSHSLLMIDADGLGNVGDVALTGDTLKVADDAFLYLDNAVAGQTYNIAKFNNVYDARGWYTNSKNIITNKLFGARFDTLSGINQLTIDRKKLAEALPGAVMRNIVDTMSFSKQDRRNNPAMRYVYESTNDLLHSDAESTMLLNVAAQPAEIVGATATALANSTDFADQAQSHFSFMDESNNLYGKASFISDEEEFANKAWVKYGHRKGSMNKLSIGGMDTDYDTSYNSVTVGYDLPAEGDFRHGVAISYGKGSNNAALENDDFNTKGVSWYGSFRKGNNNTLMDVGYYHTSHDVTGLFRAEPDTDVFTMGVTNEFRLPQGKDGNTAVIPHIGLRYSRISTPSYSGYYGGNELFRYDPDDKDIFSLPFGVGFVSENKNDNWRTRFYADVAYVPVIGGRSADMHVQAVGINAEDVFGYDVSNGSSFVGTLGIQQESNSFEWGLSYRYSGNSDWHDNDFMANVAWKF